jgi:hypothetical protein
MRSLDTPTLTQRVNRLLWFWFVPFALAAAFGSYMGGM